MRQEAAAFYTNAFSSLDQIVTPKTAPWSTHVYHQFTMKLIDVDRQKLQDCLSDAEIPSNIYYPVPAHRQKGYSDFFIGQPELIITDDLSSRVLSLPIHTEMELDQLEHIAKTLIEFIEK